MINKITSLLKKLKIKKNDIIMMHGDASFISQFSKIDFKKDLNLFFDKLIDKVGKNGAILCPTFTYSFCKKKKFDLKKSKSEIGVFSEIFRNRKDTFRTEHPIFSFSIFSKKHNFKNSSLTTCFGKNSIFERFLDKNGKILILGSTIEDSCTFLHHLEEVANVNYRYNKNFKGKIILKKKTISISTNYFVRKKQIKNTTFIKKNSLIKIALKILFGRFYAYKISSKKLTKKILPKLKYNNRYLVE